MKMAETMFKRITSYYRTNGVFRAIITLKNKFLQKFNISIFTEKIPLFLYKLLSSDGFLIKEVQGNKMILDLNDVGISKELLLKGVHEKNTTHQFKKEINEGMNILEIGANIGYYTLIAARIIKDNGHIYAFEPSPQNVRSLIANIYINGFENIVEVHREGIADKTSKLTFFLYSKSNLCGFERRKTEGDIKQIGEIMVDVTTVDQFLGNRKIDYLRMDIEGFEWEAIKGMKKILGDKDNSPRGMYIEIHSALLQKKGHSAKEFINILTDYGYSVRKSFYRGRSDISANSTDELLKHNLLEKGYWETFFVKS